ncbi:MAG TPA: PP2C family protein-serine/threonine phosphatase, partial [Acidimicrobiales bacterium]|nr:PP2C family protein-serine/threonine phosphatase [Acidimicrobiales bacterium]
RYLPATSGVEVGGDFWDVSVLPNGDIALAVGDVAGHDMTAAATMAQLRSAARALRAPKPGDPAQLVTLLQAAWEQLDLERMATAVFARLEPTTGRLQVASAGHPPPLMVEPGRAWYLPVEPAPPLGAPPAPPELYEAMWPPGAAMVLYTDGLVEDRSTALDAGLDRLRDVAAASPSSVPDVVVRHVVASLAAESLADDVALLVVRPGRPGHPGLPGRPD